MKFLDKDRSYKDNDIVSFFFFFFAVACYDMLIRCAFNGKMKNRINNKNVIKTIHLHCC